MGKVKKRDRKLEDLLREASVFVSCYRDVMLQRGASYPVSRAESLLQRIDKVLYPGLRKGPR